MIKVARTGARAPLRRVGGATYQVPVEVPARRAGTLAVRSLVEFAGPVATTRWPSASAARCSTPTSSRQRRKRKDDIYRMGEGNQAFADYRWVDEGERPS